VIKLPNHVFSTLKVSGPDKDVERFREFAKGTDEDNTVLLLDANKFIPMPSEIATSNDASKIIQWCKDNWGTKWGFYEIEIEEERSGFVDYRFLTAWSPISPVIHKMSQTFPMLTFDYYAEEETNEFNIREVYLDGELIHSYKRDWTEITKVI